MQVHTLCLDQSAPGLMNLFQCFNQLTVWSKVLREKLTGPQLLKKFPAFYETQRFVTATCRIRGSWARFVTWLSFYDELLSPHPTPKLEDHPLSAVRDCLFNIFTATLHTWRPFLHPQPEHAPCCGDREPLIMDSNALSQNNCCSQQYMQYLCKSSFSIRKTFHFV